MGNPDTAPSPTDTGYFTDGDQLDAFMIDHRLADTRAASDFDAAQSIISSFATADGQGAWPSLDRAQVATRLAEIFAAPTADAPASGYRSIDQAGLNQCGPAALLVMTIGRDPAAVAQYAVDLFNTGAGAIGSFSVTASSALINTDYAVMTTRGRISSQAEWMMLSAIRNATEPFWQPEWTGDPQQELAGMTRPEELADWMRQTNIWSKVEDNGRWASNPGIPNATSLSVAEGTDTAILINARLLSQSQIVGSAAGPAANNWSPLQYFPDHWVVLVSEVTPSVTDGAIEFTVWTWASRVRLRAPQQVFVDNYFGTVNATL